MISFEVKIKETTQPEVVSLDIVKKHLNITHNHQDDLIGSYIDASIAFIEDYTSRFVLIHEVVMTLPFFIQNVPLEKSPINSPIVVSYINASGIKFVIPPADYTVKTIGGEPRLWFNKLENLPVKSEPLEVSFDVGINQANIPKPFKQAIKLLVSHMYENRSDSVKKLPTNAESLLRPYKKW